MQIVLVDWLINEGQEPEFIEYCKTELSIDDRSKMIGEIFKPVEWT